MILVAAAAPAAASAKGTISITGAGSATPLTLCGTSQSAFAMTVGGDALVRGPKGARKHAVLKIQRCEDGRWVLLKKTRILHKRAIPSGSDQDLRLASRGTVQYVRVGTGPIVAEPISFGVDNINRTSSPCPADGGHYTVRGHITGPAADLEPGGKKDVTLYDHGHSFGEFEWDYKGVPGYDFVGAMAQDGHVSVTYDRLGYESSSKPPGHDSCYASEADVVHQIIGQLKSGGYDTAYGSAQKFNKVALAGHSQATIFNELEESTFHDADALLHFSFVSAFLSPSLGVNYANNVADCESPGTAHANNDPSAPDGYAYRGRTDADFDATNFYDADPAVVADLTKQRNVDPCGLPEDVLETVGVNQAQDGSITVPILVTMGDHDPNFTDPATALDYQKMLYAGSKDVTTALIPDAGHATMFERSAPQFQQLVSAWLTKHGF